MVVMFNISLNQRVDLFHSYNSIIFFDFLPRKISFLPPPRPKKARSENRPPDPRFSAAQRQQSPPVNITPREKSGGDTISFPENPRWKLFRILLEKGSNIVQESAQFRTKLKIARKRRKPNR